MNYRKRTNHVKNKRIKHGHGYLRRMKKVRGKRKRMERAVKIHSVSAVDFVLSTSFATYRIPRLYSSFFEKATQKTLQNVVGCGSEISLHGETVLAFYWYDLDSIWTTGNFSEFEIK